MPTAQDKAPAVLRTPRAWVRSSTPVRHAPARSRGAVNRSAGKSKTIKAMQSPERTRRSPGGDQALSDEMTTAVLTALRQRSAGVHYSGGQDGPRTVIGPPAEQAVRAAFWHRRYRVRWVG